jgi:anti-sigma B factor antagonist
MLQGPASTIGPLFGVTTSRRGRTRALLATGELDLASRDVFHAAIATALAEAPETLVVDLSRLEFLDSVGITCMIFAHRHAQAQGVRLSIVPAPARVHAIFTLCGLDGELPFAAALSG